jgi:hypothetical protein
MMLTYPGVWLVYDATTKQWSRVDEPHPETVRKCECGVWSTGGLHSDWCPCAGGDCVQAETR